VCLLETTEHREETISVRAEPEGGREAAGPWRSSSAMP
jgi:hypothetical protein